MNTVTVGGIKQNILTMTITKAKNIAHHRHNGSGMCVRQTARIPKIIITENNGIV